MIMFFVLTLLVGIFCGFIAGSHRTAQKACRFNHDWKSISSRVKEDKSTVTKQKCSCCGERRRSRTSLLRR